MDTQTVAKPILDGLNDMWGANILPLDAQLDEGVGEIMELVSLLVSHSLLLEIARYDHLYVVEVFLFDDFHPDVRGITHEELTRVRNYGFNDYRDVEELLRYLAVKSLNG